jgi:hypothetical protein
VPTPSTAANPTLGRLGRERVSSDPRKDCSRGPGGEELTCSLETPELGRHRRSYAPAACGRWPLKEPGTRNKEGRRSTRGADEHILERMEARLTAPPEIRPARKQLVDHPLGTINQAHEQGYFLMTGLKHGRAAFRLSCVAYNLTRVIHILGGPRLLVALGSGGHPLYVCPR